MCCSSTGPCLTMTGCRVTATFKLHTLLIFSSSPNHCQVYTSRFVNSSLSSVVCFFLLMCWCLCQHYVCFFYLSANACSPNSQGITIDKDRSNFVAVFYNWTVVKKKKRKIQNCHFGQLNTRFCGLSDKIICPSLWHWWHKGPYIFSDLGFASIYKIVLQNTVPNCICTNSFKWKFIHSIPMSMALFLVDEYALSANFVMQHKFEIIYLPHCWPDNLSAFHKLHIIMFRYIAIMKKSHSPLKKIMN